MDLIQQQSLQLAQAHYENFPVASILLPKHLRLAVAMIYRFAREADDIADEGDADIDTRLAQLQQSRDEMLLIQAYIQPQQAFFKALACIIKQHHLPTQPFLDLLDAFSQDVVKTRYANFDEVLSYCQRSANPVGTLMLHLYQQATPQNLAMSDHICSALQLINFYQDIAMDYKKNNGKARVYLCQDEMQAYGVTEQHIAQGLVDTSWQSLMEMNIDRAEAMLLAGKPLGQVLQGRIGFELRLIIAGGERTLYKLKRARGDIFQHRPTLDWWDWCIVVKNALLNTAHF